MSEILGKIASLFWSFDANLWDCVRVSLLCSVTATVLAVLVGAPLAVLLGRRRFPFRRVLLIAAHTGMAIPTVVIGLVAYSLLSRSGPMGALGLLYTPGAIILGEFILAVPIVVALLSSAVSGLDPRLEVTARTLGAGRIKIFFTVLREAKTPLIAATMAAFGRLCSELGIAMMVGGNIKTYTRTMTTAIAVETAGGEFAVALALGVVLLLIALGINSAAQILRLPSQRAYADVL